jgi:hypothetical protein
MRTLGSAILIAALAGCATPMQIEPGMGEAEVAARLGRPNAVHELPAGKRLEFGDRSLMQQAWMVDLDRDGRVRQVRPVRTAEVFAAVQPGRDTMQTVARELGLPAWVEHYRLRGLTAWMYPYREQGTWNSMIAVHFGPDGIVREVQSGPDPRFLGGRERED